MQMYLTLTLIIGSETVAHFDCVGVEYFNCNLYLMRLEPYKHQGHCHTVPVISRGEHSLAALAHHLRYNLRYIISIESSPQLMADTIVHFYLLVFRV